ncbi:MAG: DUF4269 domain-containing protein, partial [Myxococcota bacterium]
MSDPLKRALKDLRIERALGGMNPMIVGAWPLGLAHPDDPLQICCASPDMGRFEQRMRSVYGDRSGFAMSSDGCSFSVGGLIVQISCSAMPTRGQPDVRRFRVAVQILRAIGAPLLARVKQQRRQGDDLYTAFSVAFRLDDGVDLLDVERWTLPQILDHWRRPAPRPVLPQPQPAPPPQSSPQSSPTPPSPDRLPRAPTVTAPSEDATDEEHLLRSPELKLGRSNRWINAARLMAREMPLAQ